jgi:hypothetical protein
MAIRKADVLKEGNMEEFLIILIGVLSRMLPHPANMTAVGGLALYSGSKFDLKKSFILIIITMFISDMFIGFHSLMWATYGSLLLAVFVGKLVGRSPRVNRLVGGIFSSAVLFFVITNFAVWAMTPLYPKTINGIINCYVMALPFFRNSFIGDMFYTLAIFYFAEVLEKILSKFKSVVYL